MQDPISLNLWLKFRDARLETSYQEHAAAKLRSSFDLVRLALFGCYLSATVCKVDVIPWPSWPAES